MKNKALAGAVSVFLAVLCLVMLAVGYFGFSKAAEENRDRTEFQEKFRKRIDNFVELDEKLTESLSYEEAMKDLKKRQEEHEEAAAKHRTDTAMYSAEMGGNTMGANALLEAQAGLKDARYTMNINLAWYQGAQGSLNAASAECGAAAAVCTQKAAEVAAVAEAVSKMPAPAAPPEGEPPAIPAEAEDPGTPPAEPGEDAGEEEKALYELALDAYNAKLEAWNSYQDAKREYGAYQAELAEYQSYLMAMGEWQAQYGAAAANAANPEWQAGIAAVMVDAAGKMQNALSLIPYEMLLQYGMTDTGGSEMPEPQTLEETSALLGQLAGGLAQISGTLQGIGPALAAGDAELSQAEHEVQKQLELIWYNLGKLEEEEAELEEEKRELDEEAERLSKLVLEADELNELENKRTSAKLLLTSVKEVGDAYDESGELVQPAENYLESYVTETERLREGRLIINILSVIGAAAGFLHVPAAFEKIKKRIWLISTVCICALCAAAAEYLQVGLGLGQHYAAIFCAIFAFIQLLIVLPKVKIPE